MKIRIHHLAFFVLLSHTSWAQLSGTFTIPGSYSTVASAITALNSQGVNGPVTILVSAGHIETAPTGGYSLNATGTSTSPILFQKNGSGANPQLNAYSGGSGVPSSAVQDGIWKFFGCDYVTVDGFSLSDPNTSNPSTMEYGFGFFKAGANNGCRYNTIKNCVITLRRVNNAVGAGPASEGSRGIDVVNASASSHTSAITVTATAGANSFNSFYSNLIQNCNTGIAIIGFADTSPFQYADHNNDVGGTFAATSNTIINYGGGTSSQSAYGIKTLAQYNLNASNNYINSNNGSGVNHSGGLYGIFSGTAVSANVTINTNTITLKGAGTTFVNYGILNHAGATPSSNIVSLSGNLLADCSYTTATTGGFQGIVNGTGSAATVNITNNTVRNSTCSTNSGGYFCILSGGMSPNINIIGNQAHNIYFTSTASPYPPFYFIYNFTGTTGGTITVSSNSLSAINMPVGLPNTFFGIRVWGNQGSVKSVVTDNVFGSLSIASTGSVFLISQTDETPNTLVSGNTNTGSIVMAGAGSPVYCYHRTSNNVLPAGGATITSNNFSNISAADRDFFGIYSATSPQQTIAIESNTISNISAGSASITAISHSLGTNSSVRENLISALTGSGAINGIALSGTVSGAFSVLSNTLSGFNSAGSGSVCGYYQGSNSNVNFRQNKISDLSGTAAGSRVYGVLLNGGPTLNIGNNIIGNLYAPAASHTNAVNGICINGGTVANVFFNTVRLNASGTGADFGSSALYATANPTVDLRNNILINLSTPNGTAVTAAYRRSAAGSGGYAAASGNNLFYAGAQSSVNLLFSDGTNQIQTLTALKSFFSPMEALSSTENTSFLSTTGSSATFLHVDPFSQSLSESRAVNVPGYAIDFDSEIRQGNTGYAGTGTAPDVGADEYEGVFPNCTGVNTPTISATASAVCVGQQLGVNTNPQTPNPGLVLSWMVSSSASGPYSVVPGPNATSYTTAGLPAGAYYYRFANTCTITGSTDTSNVVSVLVSSFPTVAVTPFTSTYCAGGTQVTLTASGASDYSWSPAAGLNSTSLAAVSAGPASTTTYVVTGSNPGNCTGTASAVVVRLPSAGGITVTPSSTVICQGYNVNLQAVSTNTSYAMTPITFSPVPLPSSGVTSFCNNGLVVTWPMIGGLDDGGWTSMPISFPFTFFEAAYSAFMVSTNGFITLGSGLPNTFDGYGLAMPNTNMGRPGIGAVYSDLDFRYVGTMNTFTAGTSPNRRLVVNWTGARYYSTSQGTGTVTTQLILYETSNIIEVHTTITTGYDQAVEGIQNAPGTEAFVVPGRNNSSFAISNDAYRWTPVKNVSWQPATYLNSTSVLTPTAQNVQAPVVYTISATTGNGCTVSTTASISVIPSPTISVSGGTVPVCPGSSVSLSASGASSYTWSTGAQNANVNVAPVLTTTYTAFGTGTFNSCVGKAAAVVTVMPAPSLSITGSAALCEGKPATYSVSGADTYTWNTGSNSTSFSVTAATNSVFTVAGTFTANSCTSGTQISVSVYPNPTVSVSGSTLVCSGKSATLNAAGATSYQWSNGGNGQVIYPVPPASMNYSVTGFSGPVNCSNTAVISVSVTPTPVISVSSPPQVCSGQTVNLSASGVSTYTWSNGLQGGSITVTPAITWQYSVTGTGTLNNCVGLALVTVTVKSNPFVNISVVPSATICAGEEVILTGSASGGDVFLWSTASGDPTTAVSPSQTTTYTLQVSNSTTGCMTEKSVLITVDICEGLDEFAEAGIRAYPNPAFNELFVESGSAMKHNFELCDITGRILLRGESTGAITRISLASLAKGVYYLRIRGEQELVHRVVLE